MKNIILNDQTEIPQVGLGTWNMNGKAKIFIALDAAFASGYKQIDTAQIYNNEKEIGDYLKEKQIARDKVYLTTKVWPCNFLKREDFRKSVFQSLKRLQVEKVDLLLLHWAISEKESVQAYKWLEELKDEGFTTSIGVSNFNVERLSAILKVAKHKPAVNQVQLDIKNQQKALSKFCGKNNISMQGYSLLRPYLEDKLTQEEKEVIDNIALKHKKTWGQVILKWALQENFIIFPKSEKPQRIKANIDLFGFTLNDEEINSIRQLDDVTLKQRMNLVASGEMNFFYKSPLLFENHFKENEQKQIVEDGNLEAYL